MSCNHTQGISIRRLLTPALALPLAACATILSPGPFVVPVTSEPPGATVVYRGREVGRTPCEVEMWRATPSLTLTRAGYHSEDVYVGTVRDPWVCCNLLNLGVGMLVDVAFGTNKRIDERPAVVRLDTGERPQRLAWMRPTPRPPPAAPAPTAAETMFVFLLQGLRCLAEGSWLESERCRSIIRPPMLTPIPRLAAAALCAAMVTAQSDTPVHMATGIKVGDVRQTSAVVWTRLTASPERNLDGTPFANAPRAQPQLPKDSALADMAGAVPGRSGEVRAAYWLAGQAGGLRATAWQPVDAERDYTRQFVLEDLVAGSTYELVVEGRAAGAETSCTVEGRFRTAPAQGRKAEVSFCVVTGQDYHRRDDPANGHRIYGHMRGLDPDFLVHTGDIIYYDKARPFATTVELARFKWSRVYSMSEQREFHRLVSCYFIKDDHDTLKNDCWPGQRYGEITWERGLELFREQLPVAEPPYRRVRWGSDLEIWMVEGREFRSPNKLADGPAKTIWGAEQKRWLAETLAGSDATWRVVISPTPIVGPDRTNKNDNHSNAGFQHEGDEVRALLAAQKNTVVICGDRHWQYVSRDPTTGLREFSCGPTSDKHAGGFRKQDESPMHEFLAVRGGFLHVHLQQGEGGARLVMRHYGADGEVRNEVELKPD